MTTATEPVRPIRDPNDGVTFVPLTALRESKTNPRRSWDKKQLQELADSVRKHGILQPLLVRDLAGDAGFEVVAGARRLRAAKQAGLLDVPCFVRALEDKQVLELQFVENLQRADLHALDEGLGYKALHEEHGYSVEDLAGKLGKSKAYVYGRMQLAKLPVKAQTLFFDGKLDLSVAQLVTRIPDAKLAERAAAEIAKGHGGEPMTYRQAVQHVRYKYQCDLRTAPFPQGQKDLVPEAGACGSCPKRSGNQKGLFEQPDGERADICTDPACFAAKSRAQFQVLKTQALATGGEVIEGKAARDVLFSREYLDPDDKDYTSPGEPTWKRLMKGKTTPAMVVVQGGNGEAAVRWRRKDVMKVLGRKKEAKAATKSGGLDNYQAQLRIERLAEQRAMPALVAAAEKLAPAAAWRAMVKDLCEHQPASEELEQRRGLDLSVHGSGTGSMRWTNQETPAALEAMTVPQLQGLAVEIAADDYPHNWLLELGVDLKQVAAAVKAEEKQKAKEAKAAERAAAKAAKGKPATKGGKQKAEKPDAVIGVCRVCGCTDAKACLDVVGEPCHWLEPDLCSECQHAAAPANKKANKKRPSIGAGKRKGKEAATT